MLLRNDDFKAKLYRQYKLETSNSQDAKLEDRKLKNRAELKRILNDAPYSDIKEYWVSANEEIDRIYKSQADTSILKSEDMEMLGRLNFFLNFLAVIYQEVKQERKEFFDSVMNGNKVTLLDKVELCEIVLANIEEYGFDEARLDRANLFLIRYYEGKAISRLEQERAKVEDILKGDDEEVIRFLERVFAEGRRSYHDNNSLMKIQTRVQSIVTRVSQDLSNFSNAVSVALFDRTLGRIASSAILDIIRNRLLSSTPNKDLDWAEINGMILEDVASHLKFASEATFPKNFIPEPEEVQEVALSVPQNASSQDDDKQADAAKSEGANAALRTRPKVGAGRKPQTRKPMSERYKQESVNEEVQAEPVAVIKKVRPTSMFVGDAKTMQGALAAAAASSVTLRSSGSATILRSSASSATSLANNQPKIDVDNVVASITADILQCAMRAQVETLKAAILCVRGGSISALFSHIGSILGSAAHYSQLAARIEKDPELTLQLRDVISNTVQNVNRIHL